MLFDVIMEFFVKYIFGGVYKGSVTYEGYIQFVSGGNNITTSRPYIQLFGLDWTLGNYLSFIATIISLVIILVICCALIKKIYNMCAHIIG